MYTGFKTGPKAEDLGAKVTGAAGGAQKQATLRDDIR
jgi:hypothetical protein